MHGTRTKLLQRCWKNYPINRNPDQPDGRTEFGQTAAEASSAKEVV